MTSRCWWSWSTGDSFTDADSELSRYPATDSWSLDLTGFPQPDGTSDVLATQTDLSGVNETADGTSGELTIDSLAPALPTVDVLVTTDTEPTLTGTYDPSGFFELTVTVDSTPFTTADPALTVDAVSGVWSVDLTGFPLADGVYDVSAVQSDALGNLSADATADELVIDSSLPHRTDRGATVRPRSRAHPVGNLRSSGLQRADGHRRRADVRTRGRGAAI